MNYAKITVCRFACVYTKPQVAYDVRPCPLAEDLFDLQQEKHLDCIISSR